jgi:hypothetical protein
MYPNVFRARKSDLDDKAEAKYGLTAVFDPSKFNDKDKERWKALKNALNKASMEAFGKPWDKLPMAKRGLRNNVMPDTGEKKFDFMPESAYFANITSKNRPGVVDINKDDIGPEHGNDDSVYSGCFATATVNVFSYNNKSKGVALSLNNVRILISDPKKAPRRDNRKAAADDFDEEGESDFLSGFEEDEPEVDTEDVDDL